MPLARVVPLDAVRLVLARMELPDRQEHVINRVIVGAVEPRAPALQPLEQALAGGLVTTPRIPSPPTPLKHDPKPSRSRVARTFFQIVPHLIKFDHHRPAFRL